jgi:hypothetical protein
MRGKVNGWRNYPTWAAYVWLRNEEGAVRASRFGAGALRAFAEELLLPKESPQASYLLDWLMDEVDWREVASRLAGWGGGERG